MGRGAVCDAHRERGDTRPRVRRPRTCGGRSGQVLVLFAAVVLVLGAMCVLTIDVGRLFVCKAELQNAVDAAALGGASQLVGPISATVRANATSEAKRLAAANAIAGASLTLADSDIVFGHYDLDAHQFTPESAGGSVDSVKITGRRTVGSPDGPVSLFFGPIFHWNSAELDNIVSVGTKPRRYVMFVLDRSGSMCFDTSGMSTHSSPLSDGHGNYYMTSSPSGWYALPQQVYYSGWRTAYFYAVDDATGQVRTDFLPPAIASTLVSGQYWRFSTGDSSGNNPSWLKVPAGVTVYSRYSTSNWSASDYYGTPSSCDYATSSGPVEPIQSVMDAACSFVALLRDGDDNAGLVTYASGATTNSILTSDFSSLQDRLQTFSPCGGTAEPDGMDAGLDELIDSGRANAYGRRIMILLTDGQANMMNGYSYSTYTQTYNFLGTPVTTQIPSAVAGAMAAQVNRAIAGHVRIYCVTFGTGADTVLHRIIAEKTDGAFYHTEDTTALTDIFMDIFRRLPAIITQ